MVDEVKPPSFDWADAEIWETDSKAISEEKKFGELGKIQEKSARIARAQENTEVAVHTVLRWLIPLSLIVAFVLFWLGVGVYAYHLVAKGWLTPEQLKDLHTILFSGAIGAIVAQGAKKYTQ